MFVSNSIAFLNISSWHFLESIVRMELIVSIKKVVVLEILIAVMNKAGAVNWVVLCIATFT